MSDDPVVPQQFVNEHIKALESDKDGLRHLSIAQGKRIVTLEDQAVKREDELAEAISWIDRMRRHVPLTDDEQVCFHKFNVRQQRKS